ncbi:MAG: MFS transporter, partial [Clostridia bacterium]|nr:MFS transporter [Clostridia bacterium]
FSKQLLSMAVTGSFITYGAGQILTGILGDKVSPKKLVRLGLIVTVSMNLILPFCDFSPWIMAVVWSINGLAQAFMWPPIVKLLLSFFAKARYTKAVLRVAWGSSVATIVTYLFAPFIILILGWKGVFFFSATCGIFMIILWQIFCPNVKSIKKANTQVVKNSSSKVFVPIFFVICLAVIVCGMLRDGVATWTPSLISESFNLGNKVGILSGAVLPIFSMVCYEIALGLYRKKFTNPVTCGGIIFIIGVASALVLWVSLGRIPLISVIGISLLNGAMHGANLMFTSIVPSFYANTGKVSTVSGVLNSFVYIGSAISTYGIALLTDNYGWNVTVIVWILLAIAGAAIALIFAKRWKNKLPQ